MGSLSTRTASIVFAAIAATSGNAIAAQCGDALQQRDSSDYFDIQPTLLDETELDQVRKFAKQLNGVWHGTGSEVKCVIPNELLPSSSNNYRVEAEITQHFNGRSILEVAQHSKEFTNLDLIDLSPDTENNDFTLTGGQGQGRGLRNFSVEVSNTDSLVYDEKYRVFTPRQVTRLSGGVLETVDRAAVRLVHEIKTVSFDHSADTITVNRDVYVNGYFSANQEWQLSRY